MSLLPATKSVRPFIRLPAHGVPSFDDVENSIFHARVTTSLISGGNNRTPINHVVWFRVSRQEDDEKPLTKEEHLLGYTAHQRQRIKALHTLGLTEEARAGTIRIESAERRSRV